MIENRKKENKSKTVNYICHDISVCNTNLQRGLKKKNEKRIYHFLFAKLGTLIWYLHSFFLLAPVEGCVANRNIGQIHLTKLFFCFYVFFLSVLYILSGAEQKNLGERGDPNKALRRVKGRRAPFPHFPLSMSSSHRLLAFS